MKDSPGKLVQGVKNIPNKVPDLVAGAGRKLAMVPDNAKKALKTPAQYLSNGFNAAKKTTGQAFRNAQNKLNNSWAGKQWNNLKSNVGAFNKAKIGF